MKTTAILAAGTLSLGLALSAAPVLAAPHIIVRGATRILPPPAYTYNYYGADWGDPLDFYGNPLDRYYDPIGKIPDTRYYGPQPVDLVLARTLDRNGESIMSHALKCQAHYPTYNTATNTYYGAHGLPQVCYL